MLYACCKVKPIPSSAKSLNGRCFCEKFFAGHFPPCVFYCSPRNGERKKFLLLLVINNSSRSKEVHVQLAFSDAKTFPFDDRKEIYSPELRNIILKVSSEVGPK